MKNILYILLACFLFSCTKNEVDLVFDKLPEERMAERNQELRSKLVESINGWKAYLRTSLRGGGYGFYMKFDANENVTMLSDWNNASATTVRASTYSIRYIMNTSLIFDTYNYISIMQDPQSIVNGGTQPNGLQSDIEFEYIRSTADSVVLRGKKYLNYLYLVKASADEATKYNSGSYLSGISGFNNFLATRKSNYFTVNGKTVDLFFNSGDKTFSGLSRYNADSITNVAGWFGYTLDGASLSDNLIFEGVRFTTLKMTDANAAVIIDEANREYPLIAASRPAIEFKDAFAYNRVFKGIIIRGQVLPAGVASSFNSVFNGMVTRFNNSTGGRVIESVEFRFTTSNTLMVNIWYLSGTSRFLADASFRFTYQNGVLTLSNYTPSVSNANWNSRLPEIGNFLDWLQSGPFRVDWAVSSSPTVGTLAALYKVSNEGDFFYGSPNP